MVMSSVEADVPEAPERCAEALRRMVDARVFEGVAEPASLQVHRVTKRVESELSGSGDIAIQHHSAFHAGFNGGNCYPGENFRDALQNAVRQYLQNAAEGLDRKAIDDRLFRIPADI